MESIEFLGHSGFAIRAEGALLLCDPWLSATGGYNASWFPYPHYVGDLEALAVPDAVYVSHEHLDHYDPDFLDRLDKTTPILTGRFQKKRLLVKLRKQGFKNIIELDEFEGHDIAPGVRVRISTPTFNCPPHWFDSCCIVEAGGRKIFNLNDCNMALPVDRLREEQVDVLLAQASPAIWYPLTYTNYSNEQKRALKAARRESALETFVTAVKAFQPKLAVPTAGPPIFFDPELADFFIGEDSMFPTPPVAAERLARATETPSAILKPGDRLILGDGEPRVEACATYADFDYERDRRRYFDAHREEKQAIVAEVLSAVPEPAPGLFERFRDHLVPLIARNPYFTAHINMRVLFDVTGPQGGRWIVDYRDVPHEQIVYEDDGNGANYTFTAASKFIDQVLRDELSWEDLFLSLRFKASRDPDVYNQHLFTFFKMGDHASLQKITRDEMAMGSGIPEDTFTLEHQGARYEVQRFCPHAGSDLKDAEVVDGHIVCPGHHWRFELESGRCAHAESKIYTVRKDD